MWDEYRQVHFLLERLTTRQCGRLNICSYIGWIDKYCQFVNSTNITTNIETAELSTDNLKNQLIVMISTRFRWNWMDWTGTKIGVKKRYKKQTTKDKPPFDQAINHLTVDWIGRSINSILSMNFNNCLQNSYLCTIWQLNLSEAKFQFQISKVVLVKRIQWLKTARAY